MHGVTTNPTIFDKEVAAGTTYDDALRSLLASDPDSEKLEIEDLQMAADILRPFYDQTKVRMASSASGSPHDWHMTLRASRNPRGQNSERSHCVNSPRLKGLMEGKINGT